MKKEYFLNRENSELLQLLEYNEEYKAYYNDIFKNVPVHNRHNEYKSSKQLNEGDVICPTVDEATCWINSKFNIEYLTYIKKYEDKIEYNIIAKDDELICEVTNENYEYAINDIIYKSLKYKIQQKLSFNVLLEMIDMFKFGF